MFLFLQAKEDASEFLAQKEAFEKEKKALLDSAAEKDVALKKLVKTIGNYVHDRYGGGRESGRLEASLLTRF